MNLEERDYIVYIHTNKVNNKKYVGITCQEPNKRWMNGKGYSHNTRFGKAINKYGWDGFYHDIVAINLTQQQACDLEISLITKHNTTNPNHGYNIQLGGMFRGKMDDISKQKISESKYIKVICVTNMTIYDSIKQASEMNNLSHSSISSVCRGRKKYHGWINNLPMVWIYYDEYLKIKNENPQFDNEINGYLYLLKDEINGYRKGENSTSSVRVVCLNTKETFVSIKSACERYGFSTHANIVACCTGKSKSCGVDVDGTPLIWRYEKDYIDMLNSSINIDDEIKILIKSAGRNKKGKDHLNYGKKRTAEQKIKYGIAHRKEVICDGKTFSSAKEFSYEYGLNYNTVRNWLNGGTRMPKKYVDMGLKYANGENKAIQQVGMRKGSSNPQSKKVICNGIIFDTITSFANRHNVTYSRASKWLRGETKMPQEFKDMGLSFYKETA